MNPMEAVDDCYGDDMNRHSNRNDIMTKPSLFVECLYVFVMVSWSENVHLLDQRVHAMMLLHVCLVPHTRDVHHDQLLLVSPLYSTRHADVPRALMYYSL